MTTKPLMTGLHVSEIGSFFAGGYIETLTDQPQRRIQVARNGPKRVVNLNGDYVTGQCYVHFVRQAAPKFDSPVMFWHGGGMTGATWETTPDGRPGWQTFFLNAGFDTYVCDAVERGRSGWSPYPEIFKDAPIFRTQNEAWSLFRLGDANGYTRDPALRKPYEGLKFPINHFDTFGSQFVPRWTGHGQLTLDAYFAALERVGPVWLIAHSQGGNLALEAAARRPELFKGVIVIEPASAPSETARACTVPHLFIWGDYIQHSPLWISYRRVANAYCKQLVSDGGDVSILDLPLAGFTGNSHVPMIDSNSSTIAVEVQNWIAKRAVFAAGEPCQPDKIVKQTGL